MKLNFLVARWALVGMVSLSRISASRGVDWNQYRGPNHDGSSPEKLKWLASGPRELWKVPLKDGFSSFAIGGNKAFTLVAREVDGARQEVCVALDANSGKEVWAMPLGIAKYEGGGDSGTPNNKGGDGPRSTPAYDSGKVYTMSAKLVLDCFDAESGKKLWSHDVTKENAGRNISWQNAASPLIDGDLIFVAGGGSGQSLLGIDKKDGHMVWKGQDEKMTHSSPVAATILGVRQVIFFTQSGLVSMATKDGALLWKYPFRYNTSTAMSPIVSGNIVYCSAGYGVGAGACRVMKVGNGFEAKQLWFEPANVLNNHWSTPVCKDGYLYGLFGFKEYGKAPMKCVEIATGKVLWSKEGFGPGGCTLVDGNVLVLSDAGDLVLLKASPAGYSEVGRKHAVAGKCWSTPCVSNGRIYARSTKEGACLDVSGQTASK
ncbi:MAG: outer rane biosis protein [Pedosphaera sp.]|nr:outer rane biosis protein [Pedosphaera sp.]